MNDNWLLILSFLSVLGLGAPLLKIAGVSGPVSLILFGAIIGFLPNWSVVGIDFSQDSMELVSVGGELGVYFLLFVIGLEISLPRLRIMKEILIVGVLQVLLTALPIAFICVMIAEISISTALLIGMALSMSSTAAALMALSDKNEGASIIGRASFGVLLAQDLVVCPVLVYAAYLSKGTSELSITFLWGLCASIFAAILAVVFIFILGKICLSPLLEKGGRTGFLSKENPSALAILLVVSFSLLSQKLGLTGGIGAFLAGMLISETCLKRKIEEAISPFRDILLALFFFGVGLHTNISQIGLSNLHYVLGSALLLCLIKISVMFPLLNRKISDSEALRCSFLLAGGGEFAFVAFSTLGNALSPEISGFLSLVVVVSMAMTHSLFKVGFFLSSKYLPTENRTVLPDPDVVILGMGRYGSKIAALLNKTGLSVVCVENNSQRVMYAKQNGFPVLSSNANSDEGILLSGCPFASVIVVCLDDPEMSLECVQKCRHHAPGAIVCARAFDSEHAEKLVAIGAHHTELEIDASARSMAGDILETFGLITAARGDIIEPS